METLITELRPDHPTWVSLSLLLIIACYFRFDRLWSLRNLDLILLILLSLGAFLAESESRFGYVGLHIVGPLILIRLLADGLWRRRPRLPQNLNTAGLTFLLAACGVVQTTEILRPEQQDRPVEPQQSPEAERAPQTSTATTRSQSLVSNATSDKTRRKAPIQQPVLRPTAVEGDGSPTLSLGIVNVFSHLGVIATLFFLSWRYFEDYSLGVAVAALYVLLPITSFQAGHLDTVLPSALILWAAICYRQPFQSGALIGIASSVLLFPVFAVPIWMRFYGLRNSIGFVVAALIAGVCFWMTAVLTGGATGLWEWSFSQAGSFPLYFSGVETSGLWAGVERVWRIPVLVLFLLMICLLCWWPGEKTFEGLIARSAAMLIGVQFWAPALDKISFAYLPLFLVVMFRPSVSHALSPSAATWSWRMTPLPDAAPKTTASALSRRRATEILFR